MRLFSGKNEHVLHWLSQRVDFTLSPHTHLLWALDEETGIILGAMGFGGRMGRTWGSISIAVVIPQVTVPLVRAGAGFLFGSQQAAAGYVTISSKRTVWIRSLERVIGFREVDRVRNGIGPREDLVVLKLTPESCRPWQRELEKLARQSALEVG